MQRQRVRALAGLRRSASHLAGLRRSAGHPFAFVNCQVNAPCFPKGQSSQFHNADLATDATRFTASPTAQQRRLQRIGGTDLLAIRVRGAGE